MKSPFFKDDLELFRDFVRRHFLETERLTEVQLAQAIQQALAAGDFVRFVARDPERQTITYIPYRERETVRSKYNELVMAVVRKFDNETRHETALRYIREAEERANSGEPAQA